MRNRDSLFSLFSVASLLLLTPTLRAQDQAPSLTATNAAPVAAAVAAPAAAPDASSAPVAAPAAADNTPHAAVDPFFKPVPPGKVKGLKVKKEKPPKTIHMEIEHGVLTVDGWTGKANLNFDIDDFQYFYMWAPGVGTVIVSNHPFPGAKIQYSAFDKNTLTVKLDDHQLQLTADHRILPGKPKEPQAPAYVAVDPNFSPTTSHFPVFGYGSTAKAPYAWPGSLVDLRANKDAPPLPTQVQPTIQTTTVCPPGQTAASATSACKTVPVPMVTGKGKKQANDTTM
jgi:hypothetical protein